MDKLNLIFHATELLILMLILNELKLIQMNTSPHILGKFLAHMFAETMTRLDQILQREGK